MIATNVTISSAAAAAAADVINASTNEAEEVVSFTVAGVAVEGDIAEIEGKGISL